MTINFSRLILILLFVFSNLTSFAQSEPLMKWQKTYGSYGVDISYDVIELSSGGFVIVGIKNSYGYAVRTNTDGAIIWEKDFAGAVKSIIQTTDGNILMATAVPGSTVSSGSTNIIKIDLQGTILWTQNLAYTSPSQIRSLADGSIVLTGIKYDNLNLSRFDDVLIVKMNSTGNVLWQKNYGGTHEDGGKSIDIASDGGYILSAYTRSDDGDVSDQVRRGVYNFWILKLDNLGNKIWDKKYGGNGYGGIGDVPNSIKSTYDKGAIVVGEGCSSDGDLAGKNRRGYSDYWVLKLDSLGQKQWSKAFGGDYYDKAYSVQIAKDSNYVIAGSNYPKDFYNTTENTIFTNCTGGSALDNFGIIKINKQGDLLWRKCMGGNQSDYGYSMKITSDDGFIMVGQTLSTNGDITQRFQYNDIWVVKLDKECNGVAPLATVNPDITICKDATINLSAGDLAGARYSWKGPNSFNSTSRTPSIPNSQGINEGIYSVTVIQNGCTALATTNVKVGVWQYSSTPNEYQISTNAPVCINKTITFSINTLDNSNYLWSGPNSFSSTLKNPQIPNVTSAASGIYTVTVTSGNCIETATNNVVVNTPTIVPTFTIANNTPTWETFQFTLSVNVAGANYFTWKNPSNQEISHSNRYESPYNTRSTNSGIYSVEVEVGGCSRIGTTDVLIVSPSAIIASKNSPLCTGSTLRLSVPEINAMTYTWSGPNSFSSTLREPQIFNISNIQNGIYTVKGFLNGYSNGSSTVNVLIMPPPTVTTNSPICAGSDLNLSVTEMVGATYSWTGTNGFSSTLRSPTIPNATNLASGVYSVIASLNGCTATSSTTVIVSSVSSKLFSVQSGNWNINTTWMCGSIPNVSSEVLIKSGHIIELDSEVSIKKIEIESSGILRLLNNLAKIIFNSQ